MSKAIREAIAAAASTAPGIECAPYFVQSAEPGAAMVRLDRTEYPDKFGGVDHWSVVVLAPQDMAEAEEFLDLHKTAIRTALKPVFVVTQIQPQRFELPGVGTLLCVFFNGHREESETP